MIEDSRMAFNCPKKSSLTETELNQTYQATTPGLLPSSPNASSDRDENGMLKPEIVSSIIVSLKKMGTVPIANSATADMYVTKVKEFLVNVKAEYCFYDSRYKYSLERLFGAVRQGYITNTTDTQAMIQKYLSLSQGLNRRLNDLIQIINGATEDMLRSSDTLEEEIVTFNKKIKELKDKLEEQNKIITSNESVTKIRKEMVKFTEEKARYSGNLLQMYSFLNIVALGLLVYVYKAASD
jgi:hypothetical protein